MERWRHNKDHSCIYQLIWWHEMSNALLEVFTTFSWGKTPLKLWKRIFEPRPPVICPLFLRCSRDPYPTILGTMRQASTTLIIYTRPPINRSINTMWLIVTTTKNVLTQGCLDNVWTSRGFHFEFNLCFCVCTWRMTQSSYSIDL